MTKQPNKAEPGELPARRVGWFRERVDLGGLVAPALKKTVPIHRWSWIYVLGGAALFLLLLQVATGALLMLYYQPTEAAAHPSIEQIMTEVPYGWLVRSMHVWGANLFIAVVGLHLLTVLFARAYRKPRELTWLTGAVMFALALALGFSGYLLPWNELSYYATRVGTEIPGTIPVVGDFVVHLLRGGDQLTGATITRFFAAHVMFLPMALGLFVAVHLGLVQFQGMSLPVGMKENEVRDHRPFFTEFLLIEAGLWLVILGAIVTLAVLLPAEVGAEANPLKPAPKGIKPEWYFLFMFQTLKHVPEAVGVLFFALCACFLLVLPFLDRAAMREKKGRLVPGVVIALLVYAAVFETIAVLAPGVEHPPEELAADSYSWSGNLLLLVLTWMAVAFVLNYLWQLVKLNTRVRLLYGHAPHPPDAKADRAGDAPQQPQTKANKS